VTQIHINVNSQAMNVIAPISLSELIALKSLDSIGTAVAVNNTIVSKREWSTTHLNCGDTIDIFTLVAGG